MTLQALTGGRLIVGIGRNTSLTWPAMGLPPASNAVLVDSLDIHRRLVRGEGVTYDGPAGKFPRLRLIDLPPVPPPPVIFTAIGPKSLELAGRHFDGVMLHPFLSVDAVARSANAVRSAAAAAGRDPSTVRVYATVVVAPDLPANEEAAVVAGRAVTYLQIPGIGDSLVQANGWDQAPLLALRGHPMFVGVRKLADQAFSREQLVEVARVLPEDWLSTTSAVGTAAQVARRLNDFLAAGADELILHGSTPDQLGPTAAAFGQV
jgi:probable F420-dependent oxidoreductase